MQLYLNTCRLLLLQSKKLIICIFFAGIYQIYPASAQTTIVTDSTVIPGTTVVIAGNEYKRSNYHNFFLGWHYRREWATPVRVNNFYLDTAKGGLTPTQESGSRQSSGLRMKNKAGKEYVLRSVDKDFGNGLPEIFHGTFISRIAKDQASIGHPYAAITILPMIQATGIYHANPTIVFVPEQHGLGEYNKKYGNQLYLFEERPDSSQEDVASFGYAKNVIGTERLYEHIYEDNDDHVDQKAFAKARLFDMFIGDWGRHADQWRWAQFKNEKETIYKPIPRDRDQAYTLFDGFYPWIGTHLVVGTFLESFDGHMDNAANFNRPGRPLDRYFLNELTEDEWITIAKELQASLTDPVIENGVQQLPAPLFTLSGEAIIAKLKSRRNELDKYASSYYKVLAGSVVLTGSQKKEKFIIKPADNNNVSISIYKIKKDDEPANKPYYSRTFKSDETKSIKIYSLEGMDQFQVNNASSIPIVIIDPSKKDSFTIESKNKVKIYKGKKFEFDTADNKKADFSIMPLLSAPEYMVFDRDPLGLFTKTGLRISATIRVTPQPWRKAEYDITHVISVNYGFLRKTFNTGYIGTFGNAIGGWDLLLKARADLPAVQNFYGIGNETTEMGMKASWFQITSKRFYGGISLSKTYNKHHRIEPGIFYQQVRSDSLHSAYPSNEHLFKEPVSSTKQFAGASIGYDFRNTNNDVYPTKGVHFVLGGGYLQDIRNTNESFLKLASSFSFYLPLGKSFSLAIRAGGAIMNEDANYYHLNTLDGNENLRGYPRERFYGKNTFYNNNELRWVTNTKNYIFNGKIGLLAFFDQGRVWQPGEISTTWHNGYGGGLILIPFNKVALVGTYGKSKESSGILLKAEFFF